ncbi:hypothetical protein [Treponema sp.]|uniref:hypothetical protein n=1 Tax=Treponema sp. TaxID=166 RepID=UPI00388F4239
MLAEIPEEIYDKGYICNGEDSYLVWDRKKWQKDHPNMELCSRSEHERYERERNAEVERNIRIADYKATRSAERIEKMKDEIISNVMETIREVSERVIKIVELNQR